MPKLWRAPTSPAPTSQKPTPVDRRNSNIAADAHYENLVSELTRATSSGDHRAVNEITSEIARVAQNRNVGKVGKLLGFGELLTKISLAQRLTLAMEVLDVGTDGTAYFEVLMLVSIVRKHPLVLAPRAHSRSCATSERARYFAPYTDAAALRATMLEFCL